LIGIYAASGNDVIRSLAEGTKSYAQQIQNELNKHVEKLSIDGIDEYIKPDLDPSKNFINEILKYLPDEAKTGAFSLENELIGLKVGIEAYNNQKKQDKKAEIKYMLYETSGQVYFYMDIYLTAPTAKL